jgi:hypothetical protein
MTDDRQQLAEEAARAMGWTSRVGGPATCEPVNCQACGKRKAPRGRDVPMEVAGGYCTSHDCWGYTAEPYAGDLWPGERREDFGFPIVWDVPGQDYPWRYGRPSLDDPAFCWVMLEWLCEHGGAAAVAPISEGRWAVSWRSLAWPEHHGSTRAEALARAVIAAKEEEREIRNILAEGGGEVEDPTAGLCDHDAYHRLHPTPDVTEAPAGDE